MLFIVFGILNFMVFFALIITKNTLYQRSYTPINPNLKTPQFLVSFISNKREREREREKYKRLVAFFMF